MELLTKQVNANSSSHYRSATTNSEGCIFSRRALEGSSLDSLCGIISIQNMPSKADLQNEHKKQVYVIYFLPPAGLEQCLFNRISHHADQCHFSQRKSQSSVWSQ